MVVTRVRYESVEVEQDLLDGPGMAVTVVRCGNSVAELDLHAR
jgi:hypothetical protein